MFKAFFQINIVFSVMFMNFLKKSSTLLEERVIFQSYITKESAIF